MKNTLCPEIRTRFAPSPTGDLHIGGARTAIFSWLLARQNQGKFLLRIEDTDQQREKPGATEKIIEGLKWLGLDWDEPIIYQSERFKIYQSYLQKLFKNGSVYYCNCSMDRLEALREKQLSAGLKPKYDGHCRDLCIQPQSSESCVVRFKTPQNGYSIFEDLIRGRVKVANSELDDLVIWRPLQGPTYNFCVVVDDWLSRITHVVRGEDHLNNTHRQKHIAQALGASECIYAHVPMILDETGQKLSKRRQASSLLLYRHQGFLSDAVVNYLVKLGWGYHNQELFTREELIEKFDLSKVKSSPAAINPQKLKWINKKHLQSLIPEETLARILAPEFLQGAQTSGGINNQHEIPKQFLAAIALYRTRCDSFDELQQSLRSFFLPPEHNEEAKQLMLHNPKVSEGLRKLDQGLRGLECWESEALAKIMEECLKEVPDKMSFRGALRYFLLGQMASPPILELLLILGREETLRRLAQARVHVT